MYLPNLILWDLLSGISLSCWSLLREISLSASVLYTVISDAPLPSGGDLRSEIPQGNRLHLRQYSGSCLNVKYSETCVKINVVGALLR